MWHKMQHGKCLGDVSFILGPGYIVLPALEPLIAHFPHQFLLEGDCYTLLFHFLLFFGDFFLSFSVPFPSCTFLINL